MDILLTHGYFLKEDKAEQRIMRPYPPLGILYISSYLKSKGFSVEVFDSTFQSKESFYRFTDSARPSVVGIYVNLMTKLNVLEMIRYCKSRNIRVVVGGPEVPYYGEDFINHGADVAVIGEGELTLAELLPQLRNGQTHNVSHINGIIYRDGKGAIQRTAGRPLMKDLDRMPFPDRDAIDIRQYIEVWRTHHSRGSVSLICARGCPYSCTWCSRSVFGETHRRRSPQNVVDEIESLIAVYQPDMLWFADDVFTIHYGWFRQFYEEMKRRNIRIPFECISRADRLNEDIIRKMAELGAFRIWYGSESGSQRILDAMQRRVTVEQIVEVTKIAQRHGIETGLFVMIGYPGEEIADIDATVDHLRRAAPDTFLTTVAYPIKGTPMYEEVKERLLFDKAWDETTDRELNFKGRHSKSFYWFATRHVVNEVRAHKLRGLGFSIPFLSSYSKSKIARLGMKLTQHSRT